MYEYARRILNDLSFVALGSTWSENDLNSNNVTQTAEDLLDVVFLPHWFRREMAGARLSRTDIYEALLADQRPGQFNDKAKLVALADRVVPSRVS